jgi:oligopeptide transport system substrate-binding protein
LLFPVANDLGPTLQINASPRGAPGAPRLIFMLTARRLFPLLPALLLLLLPAGCSRRETEAAAGVRTQTLLLGNTAEPADLDPQVIIAYTDANIVNALFEGLTWIDPKTAQPVPGVAERWEMSPDGLVYTFHLRPAACWSNGDPLTADDFVFSFQRILTPAFAAEYSYMLWPIKNAQAFNAGKLTDFSQVGVKALDPHTLQVTLEQPTAYLPALAAHQTWLPVPRKAIEQAGGLEKKGTNWTRPGNLVGNGPFVLTEWTPNSRIVVEKNPRYWDAAHCRLNRIEFFPIEDPATEERAFRAGQLHVTTPTPGLLVSKIPAYRNEVPSRLRIEPILSVFYLVFNTKRPPFDRPALRRALSLAVDRDALAAVFQDSVTPARTFTPPNCGGYTALPGPHENAEEARQLLAQAGFPGGQGLPTIEVLSFNDDNNRRAMEAIQAMWLKELGVHVTISAREQRTLFQEEQNRNYSIGMTGWIADYTDPFTFLGLTVTDNGNNWSSWSNPAYDRLIAEAAQTVDNTRRFRLFQQAEAIMLPEAPVAPLYFTAAVHAVQPSVRGWQLNQLGYQQYKDVWLEDK